MDWSGHSVVIIASGPSLTREDCRAVEQSGLTAVAVNTAWTYARFCHAIYAGDMTWWRNYGADIDIDVPKYTLSQGAAHAFGITHHKSRIKSGYNSGLMALEMAINFGASRVLLLGFDCSVKNGTHYHGDHSKTPNPTHAKCKLWMGYAQRLVDMYRDADIINCSRQTEYDAFPRQSLADAISMNDSAI